MKTFFYLRTKSGLFPLNTNTAIAFESYCHFENIEIKKDLIRPGHTEISSEKDDLIKEFFEFSATFLGVECNRNNRPLYRRIIFYR